MVIGLDVIMRNVVVSKTIHTFVIITIQSKLHTCIKIHNLIVDYENQKQKIKSIFILFFIDLNFQIP